MKKQLRLFSTLIIAAMMITAASCSKDDDPADNDLFVGTYRGPVSYTDGEENHSAEDGRVTVVKAGNSYNFDFSDGIPSITGVKFEEKGDGSYVSIGEGVTGITISAGSLDMVVSNDNGTWTAHCSR